MKRCRRELSSLELPADIIQRVQSFLENYQAAQTSVVSKSWYKAWSTRPRLFFDQFFFSSITPTQFWNYVTKTVQSHTHETLKADKFMLHSVTRIPSSLLDNLIFDVLNLGVFDFHLDFYYFSYVVPAQLFSHPCLTRIYLRSCKLTSADKVLCSNLLSLTLCSVSIHNRALNRILLGCPLLENCFFSGGFSDSTKIRLSTLHNLRSLIIDNCGRHQPCIRFEQPNATYRGFPNLTRLVLRFVNIDDMFFTNFSNTFPCLQHFTLHPCYDCVKINIASHSLKYLSLLTINQLKEANFDIPNISKFKFSGSFIPPLSFVGASKSWKCEIKLLWNTISTELSSLLEFKDLLMKLGHSKIFLNIAFTCATRFVHVEDIGRYLKHVVVVEDFTIVSYLPSDRYNILYDFLWSFRPKIINLTYFGDVKAVQSVYDQWIQQANRNCLRSTQESLSIHDLKKVDLELCEDSHMEWQPIKALDAWGILHQAAERIRLKLTWGSFAPEHTIIKFVESQ